MTDEDLIAMIRHLAGIARAAGCEQLLREELDRGTLPGRARPRPGERRTTWRDLGRDGASSVHTVTAADGESSSFDQMAEDEIASLEAEPPLTPSRTPAEKNCQDG